MNLNTPMNVPRLFFEGSSSPGSAPDEPNDELERTTPSDRRKVDYKIAPLNSRFNFARYPVSSAIVCAAGLMEPYSTSSNVAYDKGTSSCRNDTVRLRMPQDEQTVTAPAFRHLVPYCTWPIWSWASISVRGTSLKVLCNPLTVSFDR